MKRLTPPDSRDEPGGQDARPGRPRYSGWRGHGDPGGNAGPVVARGLTVMVLVLATLFSQPWEFAYPWGHPGEARWGAQVSLRPSPAALVAQVPEDAARARYERAREDFLQLQREGEQLRPRLDQVAATIQNYRDAGNQRAMNDVFLNEFLPRNQRLQDVTVRAGAAKAVLDEARRELLRVLRAREEGLLAELARTPAPSRAREEAINRQVVGIRQEVNQLEREREPIAEVGFSPVPRFEVAPTDGPVELNAQAAFLEQRAETNVSLIILVDEEIRVREQRLRLERADQDSRVGIIRFDGDRPPGTGPGSRGAAGQAADGRAGDARGEERSFAELPLSEQIEQLRSVRMQAEAARDEALERAAQLRRLAIVRGGGVP
jgi:hypothetical protein